VITKDEVLSNHEVIKSVIALNIPHQRHGDWNYRLTTFLVLTKSSDLIVIKYIPGFMAERSTLYMGSRTSSFRISCPVAAVIKSR